MLDQGDVVEHTLFAVDHTAKSLLCVDPACPLGDVCFSFGCSVRYGVVRNHSDSPTSSEENVSIHGIGQAREKRERERKKKPNSSWTPGNRKACV